MLDNPYVPGWEMLMIQEAGTLERKLSNLFDRQKFQQNERLADVIGGVESRYAHAIHEDDLELISAAGTSCVPTVNVGVLLARHDPSADEEQHT